MFLTTFTISKVELNKEMKIKGIKKGQKIIIHYVVNSSHTRTRKWIFPGRKEWPFLLSY
jgi:hypothetical protein